MTRTFLLLTLLFFSLAPARSQGYSYWGLGDTTDFVGNAHIGGTVLAGGGGDNDDAMTWMLNRAGGGDVVVIRVSGSDGYNSYFFSELGVSVHSVETIRFDDATAATDSFVIQKIRGAELLFIAGGDQYDYYQFWKDSPIESAINYLIQEKKVTVGGTSAGMAILGGVYYTPSSGSLTAEQALANPFHPYVDILGRGDFIDAPYLENVVTDTHYDQRDRPGRHMIFLARIAADFGVRGYGIACNEYTAVCIDTVGIATVYGEYPEYPDIAYFLKTNCQADFAPETLTAGQALTWDRGQAAVKVYQALGKTDGSTTFDLNDWESGTGGEWQSWYVVNGVLSQDSGTGPACEGNITAIKGTLGSSRIQVFPNPVQDHLHIEWEGFPGNGYIRLTDLHGRILYETFQARSPAVIDLTEWAPGAYFLEAHDGESAFKWKLMKQ